MATNLRRLAESHLSLTLEGEWSLPVVLISPSGATTEVDGQVMNETITLNPDTGEEVMVNVPAVALRRSSLAQVPAAGEKWVVKIPTSPVEGAPVEDFIISPTHPPGGGASLGYIVLYLRRIEQS